LNGLDATVPQLYERPECSTRIGITETTEMPTIPAATSMRAAKVRLLLMSTSHALYRKVRNRPEVRLGGTIRNFYQHVADQRLDHLADRMGAEMEAAAAAPAPPIVELRKRKSS
jgi:hypothetical protein